MSEEEIEEINEVATASEEPAVDAEDSAEEQKMVPLSALKAVRRKEKEEAEQKRFYQENYERLKASIEQQQPEEDTEELITRGTLKEETAQTKQEILEELWKDLNPKALAEVNKKLKSIIELKPWLADSVRGAKNRYARAHEIVQDYEHLLDSKPRSSASNDAARIVQNAQKPGSPVSIAKSAPTDKAAFLKSIQGKKEFREYRQKVMQGEL